MSRVPSQRDVRRLMTLYPRIFFACHTRHVRDKKSGRRLSSHQAGILDHLDDVAPTDLAGLARHMGVTASTMSIAVERLVRQGFVIRSRDPADGRRLQLLLSASGRRVRDDKSVLDPQRVEALLARLAPAQRREALHGLALLADAAGRDMPDKTLHGLGRRGHGSSGPMERRKPK